MKRVSTLLLLFFISATQLFAAPPTVPASNLVFSSVQGGRFSIQFTKGNGAGRIIVVKALSPVTGVPVNGTQYNSNNFFGTAGTEFTADDEYVVYRSTSNSLTIMNLQPSTTYHVSIFEYNGQNATTEYLMVPLSGSVTTASPPTTQAHSFVFSNIIGNSVKVSWTNGNGEGRLILARKGAPVNATPTDVVEYQSNGMFGSGAVINGDNYVVYRSTGNNMTLTGLEPNTNYHLAIFEYNGTNSPAFLKPGNTASVTTLAGPTLPATSINQSSKEGNRFTLSVSGGNGSRRLIIVKEGSPVTSTPVNGTVYTADPVFGNGEEINDGEYVVSAQSNLVAITNLQPSTTYHVRVFEYDMDSDNNTYYLTSASASGSFSTATPPTVQPSGINFQNVTGSSMSVRFTAGNGSYRMLIMKEGSPVDAEPVDLIKYNGNGAYGLGTQIGNGNYVINGGVNGTAINVTSLTPGKIYHIAMFEYNGNNYPVYARPAATATIEITNEPTTPATNFVANQLDGNGFRANWTNGNGSSRIVIAKKGSPVTAVPVDNTTYTANKNFGQGTEILPGEFVVYSGPNSLVDIENLEINTTYHVAVFDYNTSASGPDYLTSQFLAGSGTTLGAPTVQTSNVAAIDVQANKATISYTMGDGNGRIFVMRAGGPVDTDPVDLTSYSHSTIFGSGNQVGTGNFLVYKSAAGSNFNVTGLNSNTTYHLNVYEYNGSSGPVYLKPAATINFTTEPAAGDNTPTVAASAPVFSAREGNSMKFNWTEGNGSSRLIVAKQGSPVTATPVNGTSYSANSTFGSGTEISAGEFVVYNNSSSTVEITNLLPGQEYHFAVFEYNGSGAITSYLTSEFLAASASTQAAPATGASNLVSASTAAGLKLEWTNGDGNSRLVVMRADNPVSAIPANLSAFPANATFGNGSQIALGEYVVYAGTGSSVTVTGLQENKTYHYSIFEFNGQNAPVYNTSEVLSGSATFSTTLPVTWAYFTATPEGNAVKLKWGTMQEENNAYFAIERSVDGQFQAIDSIPATGNSGTAMHYNYTDENVSATSASYRIRQVDIDGRFSYSQVVHVQLNTNAASFSLYPNPATSQITVKLDSNRQATISIADARGSIVIRKNVSNNQVINIAELPAGIYRVILHLDQKPQVITLLKL